MDGATTKFVTYPEVSDYHLHVVVHVILIISGDPNVCGGSVMWTGRQQINYTTGQ